MNKCDICGNYKDKITKMASLENDVKVIYACDDCLKKGLKK